MVNTYSPNSGEDQKKRFKPNMEHFFSRIQVDTYPQMHIRVKLLGGMQDVDHTQTIGGDTVKLLGGCIPHPPGFRQPCFQLS